MRKGCYVFRAVVRVGPKKSRSEWGTRDHAKTKAAEFVERRATIGTGDFLTLKDACQDVLDTVRGRVGTQRSYHEHFLTLCAHFGEDTPLQHITPRRVEEFIRDRRAERPETGRTPSDNRIVKNLGALRRVFRLAIKRNRFHSASPLDRVELPRVRRVPAGHYDTQELATIVKQLLAATTKPVARACLRYALIFFFTGLRRDELCRTAVEQVDLAGGWLRRVDGKTGFRDVPIRPPLAVLLQPLVEGKDGKDFLVPAGKPRGPRKEGARLRTDLERREGLLNGYFRRFRNELPAPMRPRFHAHTLRHSCKTWLMDCNVPAAVRDAITGHSSRGDAGRYEHATPTKVQHYAGVAFDQLAHLVAWAAAPQAIAQA